MKKKSIITLLLAFAVCGVLGTAAACGGSEEKAFTISETEYAMDWYDEMRLTADGGENVTWTSSDESIATVTADGVVVAQGKSGNVTVTAKSGGKTAECLFRIRDWDIDPVFEGEEIRAFVNALVEPTVYANYVDKKFAPESVTYESLDESVAVVENGQIKGVTVGEAEITVSLVWKNCTIEGSLKAVVHPEQSMILKESSASVYNVPDGMETKSNSYTLEAEIYDKGVKVENPEITLTALENNDYVTVTGTTVKVAKAPETSDGVAVPFRVGYKKGEIELEESFTLTVYPNYTLKNTLGEFTDTKLAAIEPVLYDGDDSKILEGRTDVVDYTVKDDPLNKHATAAGWANWNTRIEFLSTVSVAGVSAYNSLKNAGYKMISVDIYYAGTNGMFFGSNGSSSYFYTGVRNNREDIRIVNKDGVITNTLVAGEWQTVYYDLDQIILDTTIAGKTDCNIFLSCNYVGDTCYLDNVRYWYDTTVIETFKSAIDVENRELTVDGENSAKANAPENEFIEYSPVYVTFEKTEKDGDFCYKYDSTGANAYDRERRSKINAYNDLNGMAVKKGYQYIVFDIFAESGKPYFKYYDVYSQAEIKVSFTTGETAPKYGVNFFDDGSEVKTFEQGKWLTVAIRIDGKAKEAFYITSQDDSVFYVKNVRYYKDASYAYECGLKTPLKGYADNVNSAYYVGDTVQVKDLLAVLLSGEVITDYQVSSVTVGNSSIATYENGALTVLDVGKTTVDVKITKATYEDELSFTLRVLPDSRVTVLEKEVEIYCGKTGAFETSYTVTASAYENKKLVDGERLEIQVVSGENVVEVNGLTVTAKAIGTATLNVGFETSDGTFAYETLKVTTFDTYRVRTNEEFVWGARSDANITYGIVNETIGDRTGVAKFVGAGAKSGMWNDKLMIYESGHPLTSNHSGITIPYVDSPTAFRNLTAKKINYVTFDVYFTAGAQLYVQAQDATGEINKRNDYFVGSDVSAYINNENIRLYCDGAQATGKVQAEKWYTVVIDHKTAKAPSGNNYSAMFVMGVGTTYFDNVRYYHDASWMFDCAQKEALTATLSFDLPLCVGDSVEIKPSVTYLLEPVTTYKTSVTVDKADYAEYAEGVLSFKKSGLITLTVTVTVEERSATVTKVLSVFNENGCIEKDGSEMFHARTEKSTYAKVADGTTVGGRTGVYAFVNPASASWNDRLAVYETSHPVGGNSADVAPYAHSIAAHRNMTSKQYNYVTIDVNFAAGAGVKVSTINEAGAHTRNDYEVGKALSATKSENACISIYKDGVKLTETDVIEANCWYTIVINYAATQEPTDGKVWSAIEFAGCFGTVYFDAVRYSFADPYGA